MHCPLRKKRLSRGLVNMMSDAPRVHRTVRGLRKVEAGSVPHIVGSSRTEMWLQ